MDVAVLALVAAGTAMATGLGALPVIWLDGRVATYTPLLWGIAGGVMIVAAIVGLLVPAFRDGGTAAALGGLTAGAVGLVLLRGALGHRRRGAHVGTLSGAGARRALLVVGTLTLHSLPEGLAIGAAWASDDPVGLFVVLAIAAQNIPEGTVTALPLREGGLTGWRTFWIAVGTSAPQVPGALLAYAAVTAVEGVLALSFGVAAGAMLALVVLEIVPAALRDRRAGALGGLAGAGVMLALALALGA